MFICLSWIVHFFRFNIDVAIITQQYLSFHRILKRSAFASHSFCIENIVDLITLDLPIKLPKAGKVYLSIFSALLFLLELNNISADLELECVAVSSFLPPVENAWTWGLRRCCCRSLDGYSATKSWVITSAWTFMLQRFLRLILVEKTDA